MLSPTAIYIINIYMHAHFHPLRKAINYYTFTIHRNKNGKDPLWSHVELYCYLAYMVVWKGEGMTMIFTTLKNRFSTFISVRHVVHYFINAYNLLPCRFGVCGCQTTLWNFRRGVGLNETIKFSPNLDFQIRPYRTRFYIFPKCGSPVNKII